MVYRILLIGGPEDGDQLIAQKPWYNVTTHSGNVYTAERDEDGQPIMEDGDAGSGMIEAITEDGSFSPLVSTIRMTFSHALVGDELAEWEAWKRRYGMCAIPKDPDFPKGSVQCDDCGGTGCESCEDRGWYADQNHPNGRRCANGDCNKPLSPNHFAVYCSNECAFDDA